MMNLRGGNAQMYGRRPFFGFFGAPFFGGFLGGLLGSALTPYPFYPPRPYYYPPRPYPCGGWYY
ncbi:hypothetical protein HPK01_11135 [Anoxybacillus flavithermus]|nr:hypothetical protein [Anoxybacillus flavithermus]